MNQEIVLFSRTILLVIMLAPIYKKNSISCVCAGSRTNGYTFETHVTWGWALIGLFQIVLGCSDPPTLDLSESILFLYILASCDWTVLDC